MTQYRIEHDTMGEVKVPANALWGAQTERSRNNFKIGPEGSMPVEIIRAFGVLKKVQPARTVIWVFCRPKSANSSAPFVMKSSLVNWMLNSPW